MGILRYVEGVGLLALVVLPLLLISRAAHHTWLGNISGPTGVLVEIVVAISLFIAGSELIGLAGLFSITALIIVFWLVAVTVGLRLGWSVFASPPRGDEGRQSTPTLLRLVCLATMVVVATDWIARTASTLEHGFFDVDTLWYHLPFAAQFA